MSDLVKRLRRVSMDLGIPSTTTIDSKVIATAADRIEALEAALAEKEAEVARLRKVLQTYACGCEGELICSENEKDFPDCGWRARAALNEKAPTD